MTIQLRPWFLLIAAGLLLSSGLASESYSSERPSTDTLLR